MELLNTYWAVAVPVIGDVARPRELTGRAEPVEVYEPRTDDRGAGD